MRRFMTECFVVTIKAAKSLNPRCFQSLPGISWREVGITSSTYLIKYGIIMRSPPTGVVSFVVIAQLLKKKPVGS